MTFLGLDDLIIRALLEDVGHGDITTNNLVLPAARAEGSFYAKAAGVIAGLEIAEGVFSYLEDDILFKAYKSDGERVLKGELIATVIGSSRTLLTGERLALNFLQRLSGIATKTRNMGELIKDEKAIIVDTRKTTPGLRVLEKYAVRVGGANNHRFGLYDGVMIKDNHIKVAGGITNAVTTIRGKIPHTIKIEVEVENLAELQEALAVKADIIMLDNMDLTTMAEAVKITKGRAILEASGGINEENILQIAKTGIDLISVGSITHSAVALDISFLIN